jgi:hypothetical protein
MESPEEQKKRLIRAIAASLLLASLGSCIFCSAHMQHLVPANVMRIVGGAAIAFFGGAAIFGIAKYFS